MGGSALVTFRETLEAALVLGILQSCVKRGGKPRLGSAIWLGAAAGLLLSVAGALLFSILAEGFEGRAEVVFEAVVLSAGALLLSSLLLWLNRGKGRGALENETAGILGSKAPWIGLFLAASTSVLREGVETLLFLGAGFGRGGVAALAGGSLGILAAVLAGLAIFSAGKRMPLKAFFSVTNALLILFAAGLFSRAMGEWNEAGIIPSLVDPLWNLNPTASGPPYPLLHEEGLIGDFLKSLFGYDPTPTLSQALTYALFLLSATIIYLYRKRRIEKI
jgi:high-affinity iron transporter